MTVATADPSADSLPVEDDEPLVLDLFCGVGGVARTIQRYGHHAPWTCVGVDVDGAKADDYPGVFIEWDLTDGLPPVLDGYLFDIAWASPECTFATGVQYARGGENYIPLARDLLADAHAELTVIENVDEEPAREALRNPSRFCGGAFDLGVRKHRLFETSFPSFGTACEHPDGEFAHCIGDREHPVESYREAHGFAADANLGAKQLRECIPPAYVEELLRQYRVYDRHELDQEAFEQGCSV